MTTDSPELSPETRDELHRRARAGDRQAQVLLAEAAEHGWGMPRSAAVARRWYEAAAAGGDPEAAYRLGLNLLESEQPARQTSGAGWLRRAAESGHADAQASLAACYHRGRGVAADPAAMIRWGERAAAGGSARGRYNLALCYRDGVGVGRDAERAVALLRQSAEQGYARAQLVLGRLYAAGEHVECDPAAARRWYERGARQGYVKARYNLALMLLADGDPESDRRAISELRAAADAGYAKATYVLATNYRRGIGVAPDPVRAREYLLSAAEAGLAKAQYRLARQADRTTAAGEREYWLWIRRAAAAGHPKAQYRLGEQIVGAAPEARDAAFRWLLGAAENGDTRAAYLLARCYARGLGAERDPVAAYRWMTIARSAGHRGAESRLTEFARSLPASVIARANVDAIEFASRLAHRRERRRLRLD